MTGYGQARWEGDGWVVVAEVRSVNGKYFKLQSRLPHEFASFERDLEKRVRERVARGTVDLLVKVERTGARAARPLNREALAAYARQLREVADACGLPIALTADAVAALPGVLDPEEVSEAEAKALQGPVLATLDAALDAIDRMRRAEGGHLREALLSHGAAIEQLVDAIEAAQPAALDEHRQRLVDRVNRLLENTGITVGEQDLAREAAIYADRSNVAEEIARLRSHVKQLREALAQAEPVGRRLEFLSQELQREASTLGAKASSAALAPKIVALHGEVDKIREQVLNIE